MKGLVLKDLYYLSEYKITISSALFLCFVVTFTFFDVSTISSLLAMNFTMIAFNIDEESNSYDYIKTLPYNTKQIVLARYLYILIVFLSLFLINTSALALKAYLNNTDFQEAFFNFYVLYIAIYLVYLFCIPIIYSMERKKAIIVLILLSPILYLITIIVASSKNSSIVASTNDRMVFIIFILAITSLIATFFSWLASTKTFLYRVD